MTHNHLYTDHKNIFARLTRKVRTKRIDEADIIEWCQEVENDIVQDMAYMYRYVEAEFTVENNRVFLPCHVYKILDVYTSPGDVTSRIYYYKAGEFISFDPSESYTTVYIDFMGMPVDLETGTPLIIRGHEMACEAYCMWNLFFEDIISDKISIDAKNRIESRKDMELAACLSTSERHRDRQDRNRDMRIMMNWVPRPANIKLIKNDTIQ